MKPRTWSFSGMKGLAWMAGDRLAHVRFQILERLQRECRPQAGVGQDAVFDVVVAEGQHPAVRVVDEHDLFRAEQPLRNHQRADRVVTDHAAGVTDHVRVAFLEAQQLVRVETRVHAGHHRQLAPRRHGQAALVEALRVASVTFEDLIRHCSRPHHPDKHDFVR